MPSASSTGGGGPDRTPRGNRRSAPYSRTGSRNNGRGAQQEDPQPRGLSRSISSYLYGLVSYPFRWGAIPQATVEEDEEDAEEEEQGPGASSSDAIRLSDSEEPEQPPAAGPSRTNGVHAGPTPRSGGLTGSQSTPALASARSAGSGDAVPNSNARLARFFADAANRNLTEVEVEGVVALVREGHSSANIPSAFTPAFPAFDSPLRPLTQQPLRHSATTGSLFNPGPSTSSSASTSSSTSSVHSRRRPIYLGPGRSTNSEARRRRLRATTGVVRSQTDPGYNLAAKLGNETASEEPTHSTAKRRRLAAGEDEDAPPTLEQNDIGLGRYLPFQQPSSGPSRVTVPSFPPAEIQAKAREETAMKRFGGVGGLATPVKPSPLRNVTQAATPSPPSAKAPIAQPSVPPAGPTTAAKPTPAASLMLSLLREDSNKPKLHPLSQPSSASSIIDRGVASPYRTRSQVAAAEKKKAAKAAAASAGKGKGKVASGQKGKKKGAEGGEEEDTAPPGRRLMTTEEYAARTMPLQYRPLDASGRPIRMHWGTSTGSTASSLAGTPIKKPPAATPQPPAPAPAPTVLAARPKDAPPVKPKTLLERISGPLPTAQTPEEEVEVDELEDESASVTVEEPPKSAVPVFGKPKDPVLKAFGKPAPPSSGAPFAFGGSNDDVPRPFSFSQPKAGQAAKGELSDRFGLSPEALSKPWKEPEGLSADVFKLPPKDQRIPANPNSVASSAPTPAFSTTRAGDAVNGAAASSSQSLEDAKKAALELVNGLLPGYDLLRGWTPGPRETEEQEDAALAGFKDVVAGMPTGELPAFNLV